MHILTTDGMDVYTIYICTMYMYISHVRTNAYFDNSWIGCSMIDLVSVHHTSFAPYLLRVYVCVCVCV